MKIKKYTYYKNGDYHHYYEGKNGLHIYHGLVNWYNHQFIKQLGYIYQEKQKGFWIKNKINMIDNQ